MILRMPTTPRWSPIRKQLRKLAPEELIELLRELFGLSTQNSAFLATRFADVDADKLLEPYRRRIVEQFRFHTSRMTVKLDLAEARRAIREYRKATGDLFGTAELMMSYVEAGTHYVMNYGEYEERVYNSLESVLRELAALLRSDEAAGMYAVFRERLKQVAEQSKWCGYGYGDSVRFEVGELEAALSGCVAKV